MSIDDFEKLTKESLVDTNMVSDVVFEFFMEELRIKEQIKEKYIVLKNAQKLVNDTTQEIKDLEYLIAEDEVDEDSDEGMTLDDLDLYSLGEPLP